MDTDTVRSLVDALFPTHPVRDTSEDPSQVAAAPPFSEQELAVAVSSLKNRKAPGPDGIPAEALRVVTSSHPQLLLRMYNACLAGGVFPARWKTARLVLIDKGKGGAPDAPSSYRPLCMLDTAGKLLEKLLQPRLHQAIREAGDLSVSQHGFRKGHSTVMAVAEVVEAVRRAETACHQARDIVLLVTLDVKNAFNSANWSVMIEALQRAFSVPEYLLVMVRDYLKDRRLQYETSSGLHVREVTAGAAQGSVLGPDLWNVSYDSLLRLEMPFGVFLVGYADDVAAVITARNAELAQIKLGIVMSRVNVWMEDHGLQLALSKTEIVMLTKRRIPTVVPMIVGSEVVQTKHAAKYLGVTLDSRLSYWEHIRLACDRASVLVSQLSRLMANVGGPSTWKRRLLMVSAQSVLLYGAEIWAGALKAKKYRQRLLSVQRQGALRIARSYRTVSESAVLVVAGVIPIDLLAQERREIFVLSAEFGRNEAASRARDNTMREWQQRWNVVDTGRWTFRLVPDLRPWVLRGHGEMTFFLCQLLSGHGYFRSYLHKMGKVMTPTCRYCLEERDDVYHTFFACDRFAVVRRRLTLTIGDFTPETIVGAMLVSEENWRAVAAYAETVLRSKNREGCLDP